MVGPIMTMPQQKTMARWILRRVVTCRLISIGIGRSARKLIRMSKVALK
jgi:hypothetical protein